MTCRIAVVQHGDYREAQRLIGSGQPEPYFGMAYTLQVLDGLLANRPHLIVSLEAPAYRETEGTGELAGIPEPSMPRWIPGTIRVLRRARRIRKCLEEFRPTHLLLRTSGLLACSLLRYSSGQDIQTLAIFASYFDRSSSYKRVVTRMLVNVLNHPSVFLVGNHRTPATQTMIDSGLDARKAVAWDWPGARQPGNYPLKRLALNEAPEIVYVGSVGEIKGVGDLVRAMGILYQRKVPVRLTVAGSGEDLEPLRTLAEQIAPGMVEFLGRVPNEEAFGLMQRAALVCVPSRPAFPEGFPLTLTEALASRTPVVASDHPVFLGGFPDGLGVRYFRAANAESLANRIQSVLADADAYARLSELTADAFARVECKTTFGDLIDRWRATF